MPKEYKELNCRDVGTDCDFVARGETPEQVIEACAAHGANSHGMTSFPPEFYVKMRAHIRTVQV